MIDKSKDRPAAARGAIGSTLLGVLIGMALGLAIAVAVAVYVTRAPVPFINKQGRVGQGTEAARAGAELPDPNKPLAGKARPAGSADTATSDASSLLSIFKDAPSVPPGAQAAPERTERIIERSPPATPPAAAAPPVAAAAPPAAASRTYDGARAGDSPNYPNPPASSASGPSSAAGAAQSEAARPGGYVLQAGAFRGQDDADTMKAKLALLGFEARVLSVDVDGRPMFRVRVGPYGQIEDMNRARAKLAENGIDATVVRQR